MVANWVSLYFGTDAINLALVSENQVVSSYSPVGLTNNTTYYWSVIAVNNFGESTNCTVNSFTTIDNTVLQSTTQNHHNNIRCKPYEGVVDPDID